MSEYENDIVLKREALGFPNNIISAYTIVSDSNMSCIIKEVTRMLNDGWQLCGGVQVIYNPEYEVTETFYQALVKHEAKGE